MTYLAEQLADYVGQTRFSDLPDEVTKHAKFLLLDSVGVSIESADTVWSKAVLDMVRAWGGAPEATVLRFGARLPAVSAILANETFAHSMDFNDDLAGIHVGGIIPSTALAIGEALGRSGEEVVAATVLGYDVATRVADAINSQNLYLKGFQPTAVCGVFASAAVAGKLLRLTSTELAYAFGIAGSYARGTIECLKDGTVTKRYHVAKAAQGGAMAAYLARGGMTGPKSIFEGAFGLFNVYSQDARPEKIL